MSCAAPRWASINTSLAAIRIAGCGSDDSGSASWMAWVWMLRAFWKSGLGPEASRSPIRHGGPRLDVRPFLAGFGRPFGPLPVASGNRPISASVWACVTRYCGLSGSSRTASAAATTAFSCCSVAASTRACSQWARALPGSSVERLLQVAAAQVVAAPEGRLGAEHERLGGDRLENDLRPLSSRPCPARCPPRARTARRARDRTGRGLRPFRWRPARDESRPDRVAWPRRRRGRGDRNESPPTRPCRRHIELPPA